MKTEDLIQALHRMAAETGSLNCFGCGYAYKCNLRGCAVLREAAEKLEAFSKEGENIL